MSFSTESPTAPATAVNTRIKLLTFNTWGLKWVSKHRKERLRAIADELAGDFVGVPLEGSELIYDNDAAIQNNMVGNIQRAAEEYDVVALQEIWCEEDWEYIVSRCSSVFPYYRKFFSGILTGPGLAVLSKVPIESTFLYRFPINGRPSAIHRGDWYVGKSVAVTLLKPLGTNTYPIALMNSHMHAPYSKTGDANYHCHRACQAWDFSKLANLYKQAGYAVIITGDLNSRPGSLQHKFLTMETGLVDSWEQLHGKQDLAAIAELPEMQQLKVGCTTCDSPLNTWRPQCSIADACRLDYALVDPNRLMTVKAGVRFTERLPNIGSFSDHFAYSCTLELQQKEDNHIHGTSSNLQQKRLENYEELIETIDTYLETAKTQKLLRGLHFVVSVGLVIGAAIVTSFTADKASWSSIFWVLFSIFISVTGTVDGLISFLFGRKEIRALLEVRNEVTDTKRSLSETLKKKC